jgi:hypothetical protein
MNRLVLFICLLLLSAGAFAQTPDEPAILDEDQSMMYRYEAAGGLFLHSAGWGLSYRKGKHVTGYKKKFYEIEFLTMKNSKEIKVTNRNYENSKPFVFGKLNFFMILRGGVGMQHTLFNRGRHNGVEIRYLYSGGLDAGFTKPVYLEIFQPDQLPKAEAYDPNNPKHDINNIFGRAAFTYGLDKMKLYPGAYGKFALSFEYGSTSTDIKTIETGIFVDAFLRDVPIMAYINNKNYFVNLYVALTWGGKW